MNKPLDDFKKWGECEDVVTPDELKLVKQLVLIDESNTEVENPYSGESTVLYPEAVALYDLIKGCEQLGDSENMSIGLSMFGKHFPKAYMILLD